MGSLKRQRGSVLAVVVGITTLLSLSAAGLLLVAGNARSEEDRAFARAGAYYDARSGLMLGVGWLKIKGKDFIRGNQNATWGDTIHTFLTIPSLDNQSTVTVSIVDNTATSAGTDPAKTVFSRAVKGDETVTLAWKVSADPAASPIQLTLTQFRLLP